MIQPDTLITQEQKLNALQEEKEKYVKQNHHQKAYHTFKSYLRLKKRLGNALTNQEFMQACQLCNLISMKALKSGQYSITSQYLKQALHYSKSSVYMSLVTHSNLGCYHKKVNQYEKALQHSKKALNLANHLEQNDLKCQNKNYYIADCHLNMCAILSAMKKHQQALDHAQNACKMLKQQISDKNRRQVYWIGLFNLAAQLEHLRKYQQSLSTYLRLRSAIVNFGSGEVPLLQTVNKAITSLQKIVLPRKLNTQKSGSLDPFLKHPKSSFCNLFDDKKFQLSVSRHNETALHPLRSTEVSSLPALTDTQNTNKTLEVKKSARRFKLESLDFRSSDSTRLKNFCPTDRIIINKKKFRRANQENFRPKME